MASPTTEELEDSVFAFPGDHRRSVMESVARQFRRVYPTWAQENPEKTERLILRLSHGILAGKGGGGEDDKVEMFLSKLEAGKAENWPRDAQGNPLPSSALTPEQQRLFAGYRGPGWDRGEFEKLNSWDQGRKLSPGEQWDYQHRRDFDLLKTFHGANAESAEGAQDAKGSMGASAWGGNAMTGDQMAKRSADNVKAEALDWWRRGNFKTHHSDGSFSANFPQSSITRMDGYMPSGLMDSLKNQDHLLGGVFGVLNTGVPAIQGTLQGEGLIPSARRAWTANSMAHKVDRQSPILPDGTADPSDRIAILEGMRETRDSLAPVAAADSQYLQTGVPHSALANIGKRAAYELGDLSFLATTPVKMIRALSGAKGLLGGLRGAMAAGKGEALGEAAWAVPFSGADVVASVKDGSLMQPDYGAAGIGEDGKPLDSYGRQAAYYRLRKAQEEAERDASMLLKRAPAGAQSPQ